MSTVAPLRPGAAGHRPASHREDSTRAGDFAVHALRGVSLTVERGEFVAIMGASGSGKSTLVNIIGCLDFPTRGHFWLDDVDVRDLDEADLSRVRRHKIGFVFQSFNLIPRMTALANVELPLVYAGVRGRERQARAHEALERVGLGDRVRHQPTSCPAASSSAPPSHGRS